jgi:hypothetical protein
MKKLQKVTVVLLGVSLGLMHVSRSVSAAVPDSFQRLYDTGQYKPLLQQISVELAKPANKSKNDTADRCSLLMLKGEAMLHMKAISPAADAFSAAALVGSDANAVAISKATAFLIKHAGGTKYQPRTKAAEAKTPPAAIDIIEASSRKDAFAALLADLLEPIKPQMANLQSTTSLSSIENMAKQLGDARNVEIAATGTDSQIKDLLDKLCSRASTVMTDALKSMEEKVAVLGKDASKKATAGRRSGRTVTGGISTPVYGGLSMNNATELDNIVSQAREIHDAAGQMHPIFGDTGDFKTIQSDAEKIITSANKLLTPYHYPAA